MNNTSKGTPVRFAALDPYVDTKIISARESSSRGGDYILWGDGNAFPDYLLDLYGRCATLRSVINGCVDFACGNAWKLTPGTLPWGEGIVNEKGMTIEEFARELSFNDYLYGGIAFQVIRDRAGRVSELYPIDLRFLRTNDECEVFYYCENWRRKSDVVQYPAFMADADHPTSVIYVRNTRTQVYPAPLYGASLKACETEASIDTFHLNNINNNFVSSLFVSFTNGEPEDPEKEEIERNFCEKFSGADNGGRIGFGYWPNKDSVPVFETFNVEDFGARYDALSKHCRQQIFTSFRAIPALFGINPENNGFSMEEYEQAFRLFNRTQIRPVQNIIKAAVGKALGNPDAVSIVPFTLE